MSIIAPLAVITILFFACLALYARTLQAAHRDEQQDFIKRTENLRQKRLAHRSLASI
jgi:hypothetical protein